MLDCFESFSFPQPVRQQIIKYLDIFPNLDIRVSSPGSPWILWLTLIQSMIQDQHIKPYVDSTVDLALVAVVGGSSLKNARL
jgi:hypothetical protein